MLTTAAAAALVLAVMAWPRRDRRGPSPPDPEVDSRAREGAVRRSLGRVRARVRPDDGAWVADLAEVVAVGLDAGLDLRSSVVAAARSPSVARRAPWLAVRVAEGGQTGEPVSSCLDPPPSAPATLRHDLGLLVSAWRLTEEAGAPAAVVTAAAAEAVREQRASRQRAEVVAAGPRASMWLLTALPLLGPVGGLLVGFGPDRLYASTAARATAVVGLVLTAAGWWWARTLLGRAGTPATTGPPVAGAATSTSAAATNHHGRRRR